MNTTTAIAAHISPRLNVVPAAERDRAILDAVGVRHGQADGHEQRGVRRQLQVEGAPCRPDRLGGPVADACWLCSDDAHQSLW